MNRTNGVDLFAAHVHTLSKVLAHVMDLRKATRQDRRIYRGYLPYIEVICLLQEQYLRRDLSVGGTTNINESGRCALPNFCDISKELIVERYLA